MKRLFVAAMLLTTTGKPSCLEGTAAVSAAILCQDAVPPRLSTDVCPASLPVLHQLQPAPGGCDAPDGWGVNCEDPDPEQLPLLTCCER
jgi:hypothetical protein